MTGDDKKYHDLAVTSLYALLKKISNHKDFYCLNCFNSYTAKSKLKEHEEICNNHDSCRIEMPDWFNKTEHNLGEKSLKKPFAIYLDLEYTLKKKYNLFKTTQKNLIQKTKLDMSLLVGQCLQDVHLIKKKINLIIIEEKLVLKIYIKK